MIHDTKTALPMGMHPDSLRSGKNLLSIELPDGEAAIVGYCPRWHCGGVYFERSRAWQLFTPVPFDSFADILTAYGVRIPQSEDACTWIAACSIESPHAAGAMRH